MRGGAARRIGPHAEEGVEVARLFVAVSLPEPVLDAITALPRPFEEGVRWTGREQWHVTLRFLGDADVEEAATALGRLAAVACEAVVGERVIRLGRSVVCLPVAGLDSLARAVSECTGGVGDPPDTRPFKGHITLARLKARVACSLLGTRFCARFPVNEVELVESTLTREGALYAVRAVAALAGA